MPPPPQPRRYAGPVQLPPGMTPEQFQEMQRRWLLQNAPTTLPLGTYTGPQPTFGQSPLGRPQVQLPAPPQPAPPARGWLQGAQPAQARPAPAPGPTLAQRMGPQGDPQWEEGEPYVSYLIRDAGHAPYRAARWGVNQLGNLVGGLAETPADQRNRAAAVQRQEQTGGGIAGPQSMAQAFGFQQPATAGGAFNTQAFFTGLERSGVNAVSPKGARGSMQIMPGTAKDMAREMGVPFDQKRYESDDAYRVQLAVRYGDKMLGMYGNPVLAAAAYNAGPGRVDEWIRRFGDPRTGQVPLQQWVQQIPFKETRDYATRAMMGTGPSGPNGQPILPMAFDETRYREAMANNLEAGRLMEQPMEQSFNPGPAPELPAPTPINPTDFSQVTARLEATRPEAMSDKEKLRMQRRGWLRGIAQGLASVDLTARGGAGVGSLFAAIGAGALGGRAQADDEIQRREDLHDAQMREYNMLMANHEQVKAQDLAQTMRYNSQQAYDHSLRQFNLKYQDWEVQARPVIQGGRIFTTRVDAKTGERTVRSAPIDRSAMAGAMMANSQILQSIGAGQNQVGMANWQFNAANIMQQAAQSGEPQDMATAIATRVAEAIQSGAISNAISSDEMQELSEAASAAAMQQVPLTMTGDAADRQRAEIMQTQLIAGVTARAMQDPALRNTLMGASGQLGSAAVNAQRRMSGSSTTTTRQQGGRLPTITSTVRQ